MMPGIFNNRNRITFGCFLAYFVMSAFISPLGLVSGPIATDFQISITVATAAFTYLTTGVLVGTLLAMFIFDVVRLKTVVIAGVVVICCSVTAIYTVQHYVVLTTSLALIGASCGLELSAAAVLIAKLFDERLRASMLLLTDSFYSGAGVLSTSIAGVMLAKQFHWSSAYLLGFIVAIGIAVIAVTARFPSTQKIQPDNQTDRGVLGWPTSVHLVGVALLFYLIGFVSIYSWVPNYAQIHLGLSVEASSEIVSRLFLGMFIGQLIMFFLVLKLPLRPLILAYAALATLMTVMLWTADTGRQLQFGMLILGLATGGLFKTILSYGTTLVKDPSPKMVSYLIFQTGVGTAITPFISALIVEQFSIGAALQSATLCYLIMVALVIVAQQLEGRRESLGSGGMSG